MNPASAFRRILKGATKLKTALIFRGELLPISETFIRAQTSALREFVPRFAGLGPARHSLPIDSEAVMLTSDRSPLSKLRTTLYVKTGFGPLFHRRAGKLHPSLVHAHFSLDGAIALPLADSLKVPLIVTLHGFDLTVRDELLRTGTAGAVYLKRRNYLWQRASRFICISNYIRRKAIEVGYPEEKLITHYIGIDLAAFAPSIRPRQKGLVVFVGRLVPKKGCAHLIRAMRTVQDTLPDAELVIIGDGPLRSELEKLAQGLAINCKFLGSQPSTVIREWLERATVFSAPSIVAPSGDAEGLGIVFCEAQAVGTPVVSFQSGGIPEAVRHEQTGLLAPEGDEAKLAEYMLRYLTDEKFWRESSSRAIEWVNQRFDISAQTLELEEIYSSVVNC